MAPKGKSDAGAATAASPSKGSDSGNRKSKPPATSAEGDFLKGALTGAITTGVVLIVLALVALKLNLVPRNLLIADATDAACPACPVCAAAKDSGSKKELEQLRGQLADLQTQQGKQAATAKAHQAAAAECQKQQAQQATQGKAEAKLQMEVKECQERLHGMDNVAAECKKEREEQQRKANECKEQLSEAKAAVADPKAAAGSQKDPLAKVKQDVLDVIDSSSLRACDNGVVDAACPDLTEAMRTWSKAIQNLKTILEGKSHNFADFIEQISGDADYFLSGQHPQSEAGKMYSIAAANNRQVLDAMRNWLVQE